MGRPVFLDPIDYISGKISRRFRTIYCHRERNDLRYTQVRSRKRSTEPTEDEQLIRNKFSAVSKAVNARMKDLTKLPQDQAAFKAQKVYKTFRQYLWALESEAYEG